MTRTHEAAAAPAAAGEPVGGGIAAPTRPPASLVALAAMFRDLREASRQRLLSHVPAAAPGAFHETRHADRRTEAMRCGLGLPERDVWMGLHQNRVPEEVECAFQDWSRHFPELDPAAFCPAVEGGASRARAERLGSAFSALRDAIGAPFTHLVVAPWHYHPGGAERIGLFLMRYLRETVGTKNVVMYAADLPTEHAVDLPADTRLASLSDVLESPTLDERIEMLDRLILEFAPRVVFNLHSESCWHLFARSGAALVHASNLYGIVFSNAVTPEGEPYGYSYDLPECIPHMRAVIADNSGVKRDLARRLPLFKRDIEKIQVVHTPAPQDLPLKPPRPDRPRQSLWMSRFAVEKRTDILAAIAERMPQRRHLVYGSLVQARRPPGFDRLEALENVDIRGPYKRLSDIPSESCDAFVYTSAFDGLPIVLLEATAMGLPIVAPDIGGIGDFVTDETGWLVSSSEAVDEYVTALRQIEQDPELACRKVRAAQRLLRERHGWKRFAASLTSLPGFVEAGIVED